MFGISRTLNNVKAAVENTVRQKIDERLPDALVRKTGSEPVVRIRDEKLRKLAVDIDRFDGNNNAAVDMGEVGKFKDRIEKNAAAVTALRDAQPYGSPDYERYDGELAHLRSQLDKTSALERHIKSTQSEMLSDFADAIKREGVSIVGMIAARVQETTVGIAQVATKNLEVGVSIAKSAKE